MCYVTNLKIFPGHYEVELRADGGNFSSISIYVISDEQPLETNLSYTDNYTMTFEVPEGEQFFGTVRIVHF